MGYNEEELIEEQSFKSSDLDDETLNDEIDEPLESLEPLGGDADLEDEEEDPDSHYH